MPFKSSNQLKACFASNGFGGRISCRKWAKETKNIKGLPKKVKKKGR